MSQTSYSQDPAIGFAGMIADGREHEIVALLNEEASANLPMGVFVKLGTTDRTCKLPAASGDNAYGLVIASADVDSASLASTDAIAPKRAANVGRKGAYFVLPEQTVAKGDPVYMRYTAGAGALTVGRLRKDADGTAQVNTITPTAVNSTVYNMAINGRAYAYTSDGSATAAEIVTGFTTVINADTANGVTASGTTTLILTANVAGAPFVTSLGANLAEALTTPNVAKAKLVPGAVWDSAGANDTPVVVSLNLPA